jgi:hypothetical protein
MKTPTAVVKTLEHKFDREYLRSPGFAEKMLQALAQRSTDFTVKLLAQGALWSDATGRTSGTVSLALRKATKFQAARLIHAMVADGLTVQAEVPAWLNANALAILA